MLENSKITSIGCYYTFDKCVIIKSIIANEKLHLYGESYHHISIKEIADKLKICTPSKIFINEHSFINEFFHGRLNEIDFTNETLINQVTDCYKSLLKDEKLIFNNIDCSKSHDLKALLLTLKAVQIKVLYKQNNHSRVYSGGKIQGVSW
jgi:hypothetical protein